MDWELAIARNREALARIVAMLVAMAGLSEGSEGRQISRALHRAVLSVLRPAEAAVRRLIIVVARDIVVKLKASRPSPKGLPGLGKKRSPRASFQLHDPRKRFDPGTASRAQGPRAQPLVRIIDVTFDPRIPLFREPAAMAPAPAAELDDTVDAASLSRRLAAIQSALDDLPRQARRYARWRAKPFEARRPRLSSLLRPGAPPGFRKRPIHEVDHILAECHWLARHVPVPDTS
jgi:hypothetical protein